MIALEDLYFEWLLTCIDPDGVTEGVGYLAGLLHRCEFERRVGNDINRAVDGADLRKEFFAQFPSATFDPAEVETLSMKECTWLEMLIALSRRLDYLYDGGVFSRFVEMVNNMRLGEIAGFVPYRSRQTVELDQRYVDTVTSAIDNNKFRPNGHGGIFPLRHQHRVDQRRVEIWEQCGLYFSEKLGLEEGVYH